MMRIAATAMAAAMLATSMIPGLAPRVHAEQSTDPDAVLASMTTEEKIGQLLWTHVYGSSADDTSMARSNQMTFGQDVRTPAQAVKKYHLGGVLYFNWSGNVATPTDRAAVARLSNGLQQAARESSTAPLAITIDQEGGLVARITSPATEFPGNMALGAVDDPAAARAQGVVLGRELHALGINVDFAPDVDVNTNPANPVIGVRSMGDDPQRVGVLGAEQIRGIQSQGVGATAKHFPGHGDTQTDSHLGLPVVSYGRATLDKHLIPFRRAIDAGTDMIMTAHIVVKAIDPDAPATLSHKVLTGLLRDGLGYRGVITTDALDMEGAQLAVMSASEKQTYARLKAAADAEADPNDPTGADAGAATAELNKFLHPIRGRVAVRAFQAGSDILLNSHDAGAVVEAMRDALDSGRISQQRLDESVLRILRWKERRHVTGQPVDISSVDRVVGSASDRAVARDIAQRSVTMLSNDGVLPLKASRTPRVLVTGASWGNPEYMTDPLRAAGFSPTFVELEGQQPRPADVDKAVRAAREADVIVATTYNLQRGAEQDQMLARLRATGRPVIQIAARNPYDLAQTTPSHRPNASLALYSNRRVSLEAAVRAMAGLNPEGRLPVNVPDPDGGMAFPRGFGLHYRVVPAPTPSHPTATPSRPSPSAGTGRPLPRTGC